MTSKRCIWKIDFGWKLPDHFNATLNEHLKAQNPPEKGDFMLETLSNSVLQIFADVKEFETAQNYIINRIETNLSRILQAENLDHVKKKLKKARIIPKNFPKSGTWIRHSLISGKLPTDKTFSDYTYFEEIDDNIKISIDEDAKSLFTEISSEEALIKLLAVAWRDLLKKI